LRAAPSIASGFEALRRIFGRPERSQRPAFPSATEKGTTADE
jgi:hypothetical protein